MALTAVSLQICDTANIWRENMINAFIDFLFGMTELAKLVWTCIISHRLFLIFLFYSSPIS